MDEIFCKVCGIKIKLTPPRYKHGVYYAKCPFCKTKYKAVRKTDKRQYKIGKNGMYTRIHPKTKISKAERKRMIKEKIRHKDK